MTDAKKITKQDFEKGRPFQDKVLAIVMDGEEGESYSDGEAFADVLQATKDLPAGPAKVWTEEEKRQLAFAAQVSSGADEGYCQSEVCKNEHGRTRLRSSRIAAGICSYCDPE